MTPIYYIEDDETIAQLVKEYLVQRGYGVSIFPTISRAKEALTTKLPALLLIDWNMPDGNGSVFCQWIRSRWRELPVIFLTVRSDAKDIVSGFQNGADDYVVKPFSPRELMLRIDAILRRAGSAAKPDEAQGQDGHEVLQIGGLCIDFSARLVYVDGERRNMSPKEYELLFYLVQNRGRALTREKIITEIWGYDYYGDDRTLDTHIKLLRKSLGKYAACIVTLRGVGYRFEAKEDL